jgi:hypothetical protein
MNQTIHILKKDIRCLRMEIAMVLVMAALYGWLHNRGVYPWWALLSASTVFLIVRVIHTDPIPGENQFWITRPYQWTSLLSAKILFLIAFINVPVFLAQTMVFTGLDFPLSTGFSGILWSQFLIAFACVVPIAALATLTPGIGQFIVSGVLTYTVIQGLVSLKLYFDLSSGLSRWPEQLEWVRNSIGIGALVSVALVTLYLQYRSRNTFTNRAVAVGGLLFAVVLATSLPLSWGMSLQAALSAEEFIDDSFDITLNPMVILNDRFPDSFILFLGFDSSPIPDGMDFHVDAIDAHVTGTGTETSEPRFYGGTDRWWPENRSGGSVSLSSRRVDTPPAGVVTIRASLLITAFGSVRDEGVELGNDLVDVFEGIQCRRVTGNFDSLNCRSPLRPLASPVYATVDGDETRIGSPSSYSPYPGGIDVAFVANYDAPILETSDPDVTLAIRRPLAHFRKDIEMQVDLANLEVLE